MKTPRKKKPQGGGSGRAAEHSLPQPTPRRLAGSPRAAYPRPVMASERIESRPDVMLGKPVTRGTRIPVELILRRIGEGATEDDLLRSYPHLSREDIRAAVLYAADELAGRNDLDLPESA